MLLFSIQKECFNITSLIRKVILGHEVYKFDPFSSVTHRFNPLYYVSMGTSEGFNQLENLSLIIYPIRQMVRMLVAILIRRRVVFLNLMLSLYGL